MCPQGRKQTSAIAVKPRRDFAPANPEKYAHWLRVSASQKRDYLKLRRTAALARHKQKLQERRRLVGEARARWAEG